ncbi:MAG: hypothetical protein ING00_11995 [Roseomonas sp.]|nr:hypothetical protein [Roseomonas sp.]MCA3306510.1 hypothetical protein [Roseomonas sp.]
MGKWLGRFLGLACTSPRDIEPFGTRRVESFQATQIVRFVLLENETLHINEPRLFSRGTFKNTKFFIRLGNVTFDHCKFIGCSFSFPDNSLTIHFFKSELGDCFFENLSQSHLGFQRSELRKVRFANPFSVAGIRMRTTKGLETCAGLENISIENPTLRYRFERDLEATPLPLVYKHLTWATLRGFGSLPFFGLSYGGTALILFLLSVIDHYNAQIGRLKVKIDSSDTIGPLQSFVERLNPLSLNWQMPTLLLGAMLLMIASTIYALKCPQVIKESSLERWTNELGKSAINYVPLTWRNPSWRWVCGLCFLAGSTATAVVLLTRLVEGFAQAFRNL